MTLRAQDQRPGEAKTLLLDLGQHMGIVADVVRQQQADHAQGVDDLLLPRFGVEIGIQPQRKIGGSARMALAPGLATSTDPERSCEFSGCGGVIPGKVSGWSRSAPRRWWLHHARQHLREGGIFRSHSRR